MGNRRNDSLGFAPLVVVLIIVIAGLIGWCVNVYKFVTLDFDEPYKAEVVRGIGIPVAIMGSVLSLVTFEEELEK